MSNPTSISDLERAEHLGYADSKGVKRVSIFNNGVQVNSATEEKQDDTIIAINNISGLQRSTDMEGGGIVSVGTTAVEMTFTGTPESIIISAVSTNTGIIYIGKSTVTNAGANAIAFLQPGESIELSYNDTTNAIYAVATVAAQSIIKGCLI
jgi:hypothetical protein